MKLFKTTLESHKAKSRRAMDVFRQTLLNLTESNKEIAADISVERAIVEESLAKIDDMEEIVHQNVKMKKKISDFFEL